jgi:hypothetical protein
MGVGCAKMLLYVHHLHISACALQPLDPSRLSCCCQLWQYVHHGCAACEGGRAAVVLKLIGGFSWGCA